MFIPDKVRKWDKPFCYFFPGLQFEDSQQFSVIYETALLNCHWASHGSGSAWKKGELGKERSKERNGY